MEASALPGSVGLARPRIGLGIPLLRLRSDEQLVSLFRGGHEEAFRVIHDRYRQRLHAYSRQMLAGSVADAEDVVQEIFVRAYGGLRSNDRELALRAWLYRVAHNRCIDEVRRPQPIATEAIEELTATPGPDPMARVEQRDVLRRLIADVRRLPEQQRSALLMRELGGMSYAEVAVALGVSVPAVKSLLVRARVGLAQAGAARDTSCAHIREDLIVSHDRGVRTSGLARRHIRDCADCRRFRSEVRGVSRQLAGLLPALGPIGVIAKLLGGSASGGGAAAGTSAVATSGAAAGGTGAFVSIGAVTAGAGHVVTLIAAAVVTAGGAIELQRLSPPASHVAHHRVVRAASAPTKPDDPVQQSMSSAAVAATAPSAASAASTSTSSPAQRTASPAGSSVQTSSSLPVAGPRNPLPLSEVIDPDLNNAPAAAPTGSTTPSTSPTPVSSPTTGTTTTTGGSTTSTTPTTSTGTSTTGTTTTPSTGTTPSSSTVSPTGGATPSATKTPTAAAAPLTGSSKAKATGSGSGGAVALGATGSSTRAGSVRVYKSTHR